MDVIPEIPDYQVESAEEASDINLTLSSDSKPTPKIPTQPISIQRKETRMKSHPLQLLSTKSENVMKPSSFFSQRMIQMQNFKKENPSVDQSLNQNDSVSSLNTPHTTTNA